MENEIWKDVVGYEGLYQVSNLGRVKSVGVGYGRGKGLLKQVTCHYGYKISGLSRFCKVKCFKVHRLVALAFLPNPENKREVNHINGIKTDNRLENLEWATSSENQKHAFRLGLQVGKKGGENPQARKVICKITGKIFDCAKDASKYYGINYATLKDHLGRYKHRNKTNLEYLLSQN